MPEPIQLINRSVASSMSDAALCFGNVFSYTPKHTMLGSPIFGKHFTKLSREDAEAMAAVEGSWSRSSSNRFSEA